MAEPSKDNITEEREELMVSATGGHPTLRTAHFLKPSITSKLPLLSLSSVTTRLEVEKLPLKIAFNGWRVSQMKWKTWVHNMHSSYHSVWKKAGIYEAVMGSSYDNIPRNENLVFGVAERWCSETNTFVFPWGEATITLEDMMILGGYSVLGDSVSTPLETRELGEIEEGLIEARREVVRSKAQKAYQSAWINQFMESGSKIEHQAFLALWLSRFVFPANSYNTIGNHTFPIAVHLARGTKLALAPAVLAGIYRDLSLLKETIVNSTKLESKECNLVLTLWAPLQLVQIWVWERFPPLRPKPNYIEIGEPRLARWHKVKKLKLGNVRSAIDSAGESFQWRPYATILHNWSLRKFYKETEEWVLVDQCLDEELESFARCLRVCKLVGIGIIELYLPHRVAMQFGMDQDLPGCVGRSSATPENAWNNYSRPIRDAKLYIPSRLFESDVTTRYFEWWKKSMLSPKHAIKGVVQWKRNLKISKRSPQSSKGGNGDNDASIPPEFPLKCSRVGEGDSVEDDKLTIAEMLSNKHTQRNLKVSKRSPQNSEGGNKDNDASVPPGFTPKCYRVGAGYSDEEDKLTLAEISRSRNKHNSVGNQPTSLSTQLQSLSSSTAGNGIAVTKMESPMKLGEKIMQSEAAMEGLKRGMEDANESKAGSPVYWTVGINGNEGEDSSNCTLEKPGMELEARISKLERVVAALKAERFGYSF